MNFQEFFDKKKIDLEALRKQEPRLYSDFEAHFEAMGPKSFDHTKKYWFNGLRKLFPLKTRQEEILPSSNKPASKGIGDQKKVGASIPAPKGFTPRFKSSNKPAPANKEEEAKLNEGEAQVAPPKGFTPRFKSSNKPAPANKEEEAKPNEGEAQVAPPKGFTPRFKSSNKSASVNKEEEIKSDDKNVKAAPPKGFTPRFKK